MTDSSNDDLIDYNDDNHNDNDEDIQISSSNKVRIPTSLELKEKHKKKEGKNKHKKSITDENDNGNVNGREFTQMKRGRNDTTSIDESNPNKKKKNKSFNQTPSIIINASDYNNEVDINTNDINDEEMTDNYNENPWKIDSYITKNDKQKIMLRVEIPNNQLHYNNSNDFMIYPTFQSIRHDLWKFTFIHQSTNKNQGGKIILELLVTNQSQSQLYNSQPIQFEIDLTINVITFKNNTIHIKDFIYSSPHTEEVIIPPETYISNKKSGENLIVLIELNITKNYDKVFNTNNIPFSHTGIINEGATCYMNSMLQTLNSIGSFKRAVFQIPTEKDDYDSVALSLQRLFYDLMQNNTLASTKSLLHSFGWSKEQMQVQHDVQEFNLLLSEVMEKKMKGSPCEGSYTKLFQGQFNNYIQCVNVDFKSKRIENFNDLQLTVKGNNDIYDSLDAYTDEEILDNDDKYDAEGYGKQKAKKGIQFISFPSVLTFQLKRFEYNSKKDIMVKINDKFVYYEVINLKKYISKEYDIRNRTSNDDDEDKDYLYTLHSVVVHQGNANSGHYYAYIKPTSENFWVLYNDDTVRPADSYEIFTQNFGGNHQIYKHKGKGEIVSNNANFERSAYILVYIKKNMINSIMAPVTEEHVPLYLRKRFEKEKEQELEDHKKKKRNSENVNVILFTSQNCYMHNDKLGIINSFIDLNYDSPLIYNQQSRMLLSFPKQMTIEYFLLFISQSTNIPLNNMLLFEYTNCDTFMIFNRQDYEFAPFDEEMIKTTTLSDYKIENKKQYICFYLHIVGDYQLFDLSLPNDYIEEYDYGDNKIIYIPRNFNSISFKKNLPQNSSCDKEVSVTDARIMFIKRYDKEKNKLNLVHTFYIKFDGDKDGLYHYNLILEEIRKCKEYQFKSPYELMIEKSSLKKWKEYPLLYLTSDNSKELFLENTSFILIPIESSLSYNYDTILSYINHLNSIIYIDIYSIYKVCLMKKIKYELIKNTDENLLKSIIVTQIKERNLIPMLTSLKNNYYINELKQLIHITESYLNQSITYENIKLIDETAGQQRQTSEVKDFALLFFFNQLDCKFTFSFSLYKQSDLGDNVYYNFYLYDLNNNEQCLISVIIPKKIKRCSDILDYLYESITPQFDIGLSRRNYYCLLQHRSRDFMYHLITDQCHDLRLYENKAKDIEYRLQPYSNRDTERIENSDYRRVFLNFAEYQKVKIDPMMIYLNKATVFFDIKNEISDLVIKHGKFAMIKDMNEAVVIQINKAKMIDGKMVKDCKEVIKEDDTLESIFKDYSGVLNFYIEFQ